MRRNDYDVTDSIRTTDPEAVAGEVVRIYRGLYNGTPVARAGARLPGRTPTCTRGRHPDYLPCDTEYHDIQHVLDVTLAMARLMDGYHRSRRKDDAELPRDVFVVGTLAALFHDFGYLRRRHDHRHRFGAEYTLTHVSRGAAFLRRYVGELGLAPLAPVASTLVHYTGYERPAESIRVSRHPAAPRRADARHRGHHRADVGPLLPGEMPRPPVPRVRARQPRRPQAVKRPPGRTLPVFASGEDLVQKTPGFYQGALKRLDLQLARAYEYAARHFGGTNLYLDEMRKNVEYAQAVAADPSEGLRRHPPSTLAPEVRPYPKDLMKL